MPSPAAEEFRIRGDHDGSVSIVSPQFQILIASTKKISTDSEALESALQTKLTLLEITQGKAEDVLKSKKRSTIARHTETLKETLTDVETRGEWSKPRGLQQTKPRKKSRDGMPV